MEADLLGKYDKENQEYTLRGDFRNPEAIEAFFTFITNHSDISSLVLDKAIITDVSAGQFAKCIKDMVKLRKLTLTDNAIGPDGGAHICEAVLCNGSVDELIVRKNNFGDQPCKVISEMIRHKKIRNVTLQNVNLTIYGLKILFESLEQGMPLELLDVSFNDLGDAGAVLLARMLHQNKPVRCLHYASTGLSDSSMRLIIEALQVNHYTKIIDISFSPIDTNTGLYLVKSLDKINKQLKFSAKQIEKIKEIDNVLKKQAARQNKKF